MRGDLAKREPGWVEGMAGHRALPAPARGLQGASAVRAARRPAVRERRHPHRHRGQQDPQGHDGQVAHAGGLRRAVRAGLGLPRHADRGADREEARQADPGRGDAAALARLRDRADRPAEGRLPAARRARRLGQPVPHDGLRERGRRDPHPGPAAREGLRVPRPEAGQLVLRLRLGARRGGGRVRGPQGRGDRRRLSVRRPHEDRERVRARQARRQAGLGGDLDHHALDDSGEPGAQRSPGVRLQPRRHAARLRDRRRRPPGGVPARFGLAGTTVATARARRSSTSRSGIRSTTAPRRCTSASTSRSSRARASCTARRPTASRTSNRAAATG